MRDLFGTRPSCASATPSTPRSTASVAASVPGPSRPRDRAAPGPLPRRAAADRRPAQRGRLGDGLADLVARVARGLAGPPAPPVRLLPRLVELDRLRADPDPATSSSAWRQPAWHRRARPAHGPRAAAVGDEESGKSATLRAHRPADRRDERRPRGEAGDRRLPAQPARRVRRRRTSWTTSGRARSSTSSSPSSSRRCGSGCPDPT